MVIGEISGYLIPDYKDRAGRMKIGFSWLTHDDGVAYGIEGIGEARRPDTRKSTRGDESVITPDVPLTAGAPEISPDGAIR